MAFFPCIYFESLQQTVYALCSINMRKLTMTERIDTAIDRLHKRTHFHELLYKMTHICCDRHIPLVIENPASQPNYLVSGQNFPTPTIIDKDRTMRGDWFVKPTAYWFFNCEPTHGETLMRPKERKTVGTCRPSPKAGECSLERSLISLEYARNFICDFVLGRKINGSQLDLFEEA